MRKELLFSCLVIFVLLAMSIYWFLPRQIGISSSGEIIIIIEKIEIVSKTNYGNDKEEIVKELIDQLETTSLRKIADIPKFFADETIIISLIGLDQNNPTRIYLQENIQGRIFIDHGGEKYRVKDSEVLFIFLEGWLKNHLK